MQALAAIASIIVGAAFLLAGFLKRREGPAWPRQAAELGVPRPIAVVVPWLELVVGALSVVPLFLPWSAAAAIVMLVAFTVVIVRRLLDGTRPPCACFGSRSNRPLSGRDVVRNLVLLVLAVLAAVAG